MSRLDELTEGKPLWNPHDPYPARIARLKKLHEELEVEHDEACDDDRVDAITAGVLLGALNLIAGLLDAAGGKAEVAK